MKNLSGLVLRTFVFFFVFFTLPRLAVRIFSPTYINGHAWPHYSSILIQGIVLTAFMTLLMIGMQIWSIRKISKSADTDYGVRQTLETQVSQSVSTLFESLKNTLANLQWEMVQQDDHSSTLRFKVYNKWRTWNDVVTIQLLPQDNFRTTVLAESKQGGWLALADNGNNLRNIRLLREVLGR